MTGDRRRPGRPRSSEADEAILQAALDLLIDRGVEATSIERIAEQAGVTRATVYRRFPDKIRLLVAAIHRGYDMPPDLPDLPQPRDVEEMLSWMAQAIGGPGKARGRRLIRRLMTSLHDYPELEETFTKVSIEPRHRLIRAVLERERDRGWFPPDTDLDVIQQILTGAIALQILNSDDDTTVRDIEANLLAVLRETRYRRNPPSHKAAPTHHPQRNHP